jgi:hypothetical protein
MLAITAPARHAIATPSPVARSPGWSCKGKLCRNRLWRGAGDPSGSSLPCQRFHRARRPPRQWSSVAKPSLAAVIKSTAHVILEQLNVRRLLRRPQERRLDFITGQIVHMQDAPFRMAALAAKVQLPMPRDIALVESATRAPSAPEFVPGLLSRPSPRRPDRKAGPASRCRECAARRNPRCSSHRRPRLAPTLCWNRPLYAS